MSDLTAELNLSLAVDDDDDADYLTIALRDSLNTIDGLFNSVDGHSHNGAHQGGQLEFQDLNVANNLTVVGQSDLKGPVLAEGTLHVSGAATFDGAINATLIDSLFAGTVANPSANYTVATKIMWVYAQAAITVTLPAAASTNRPIEVYAVNGQVTLAAAGGSIIGGSVNLSTGAVQNGIIITGDAITYKSDGTNWRAV